MNKNLLIGLVVVVLLVGGYFVLRGGETPTPTPTPLPVEEAETPSPASITLELGEQNESGESGMATLTEVDGQLQVVLSMTGFPEDTPQPAHIHEGSCPDVGPVTYPLTNVLNGDSETMLEVTLAQLASEMPLAINVHKSGPEASVYVSCGDLPL